MRKAVAKRQREWEATVVEAIDELRRMIARGAVADKTASLTACNATRAESVIITRALHVLETRLRVRGAVLSSPQAVRDYLRLRLADRQYEVFVVLFLDAQNGLLAAEELFRGTLSQTSVYPREVVKAALGHNAAAVVFAHNHPSGVAEPSRADELLTQSLKQALALIDVRALDHFVVAGSTIISFAERGLI